MKLAEPWYLQIEARQAKDEFFWLSSRCRMGPLEVPVNSITFASYELHASPLRVCDKQLDLEILKSYRIDKTVSSRHPAASF